MFNDTRKLENGTVLQADICIIGGGASSITLAREFANKNFSVCILESGGLKMDSATQKLEKVVNVGRSYPKLQRLRPRAFGGATNLWGGHLVPLRGINFEKQDWMPYSGWPFGVEELAPYYERAANMLKVKDYSFNTTPEDLSRKTGIPLFPFDPAIVETTASRYLTKSWNKAPSLAEVLKDEIRNAANLQVYLYANVTAINADKDGRAIESLDITTLSGKHFTARAKYFILATGGIENARTLLLSDHHFKNGIGNQNDLVGRFFMEHITYINGAIIPKNPEPVLRMYGRVIDMGGGAFTRCHIAIPQAGIREYKIPDFRSEIIITDKPKPSWFEQLIDDIHHGLLDFHILDSRIIRMLRPYMKWDTNLSIPMDEEMKENTDSIVYRLSNYVEQVPNPDSRVTLTDKRDALGQRMAQMDWRLCDLDRHGVRVAHEIIRKEVERSGFGRMDVQLPATEDEILAGAKGGAHHMGTTRMSDNPKEGVVDANSKIHGLENMFIAGSSVFPTGGYSNPTFTILAMTIRLADHIKTLM